MKYPFSAALALMTLFALPVAVLAQTETPNPSFPFWKINGNSGTTAGTNFIGTTDAIDWVVKTNSTERLRVLSTGNVGIGIAAPTTRLHVYHATSDAIVRIETPTTTNEARLEFWKWSGTLGASVGFYPGTSDLRLRTLQTSDVIFEPNSTEVMRVLSNGNVGIGTSSPASRLHVAYVTGSGPVVTIESGNSQYPTALSILAATHASSRRTGMRLDDWYIVQDIVGTGTKDFSVWQSSANQHRLSITTGGNVGIGTTTATQKLDVVGAGLFRNGGSSTATTGDQLLLSFNAGTSYTQAIKTRHHSAQDQGNAIDFYTWDFGVDAAGTVGTKRVLTIDGAGTNGRVGIGNVSVPTTELDVNGKTRTTTFQMTTSPTNNYVLKSDATGNGTWADITTLISAGTDWSLTGNSSTTPGTNFIGTTDAQALMFKVNNIKAGYIDNSSSTANTGIGYQTLLGIANGINNTAMGYSALAGNTNGGQNTAIGKEAMLTQSYANSGTAWNTDNTAVGYRALYSNQPTGTGNGHVNTAIGSQAMRSNTTGYANVAVGFQAMVNNTSGLNNTAMGWNSLSSNTTSIGNTAIGYAALASTTTGNANTVVGIDAARNNTTGVSNAAYGTNALRNNVTGSNATALGSNALQNSNSTATAFFNTNVAVGYEAIRGSGTPASNTGNNNTGVGYQVLQNITSAGSNVAVGYQALLQNISGGANVATGYQALNNTTIGYSNTATGHMAGSTNTTGARNTLFGDSADVTTTGLVNATAIGYNARVAADNSMVLGSINGVNGATTTVKVGIGTTTPAQRLELGGADGIVRLGSVATGGNNIGAPAATTDKLLYADANGDVTAIANGSSGQTLTIDGGGIPAWTSPASATDWTLYGNGSTTDGANFIGTTDNTPFTIRANNQQSGRIDQQLSNAFWGYWAGLNNINGTTGVQNVAVGTNAMIANTSGSHNTALGTSALETNTASDNVAVGYQALTSNTTGATNLAAGNGALTLNNTGSNNVAVGADAGSVASANGNCTFLGYDADNTSSTAWTNSMALGNGARIDASNKVVVGNTSVSYIGGQVGWTTISDGRYKNNVRENVPGLAFIMKLRPVTYNYDIEKMNQRNNYTPKENELAGVKTASGIVRTGFIAQEVEQSAKEANFNFDGVCKPEGEDDNYGLRYAEFTVPLVKAVQEQQQVIETIRAENAGLKARLAAIEKLLMVNQAK